MKLTGFDRFALSVFPKWGTSRLRARATADLVVRNYEAAVGGRRTSGWARRAGDADSVIQGALVELRMHARDLERNNSWAKRAVRIIGQNTVGWGIYPKAVSTDANLAAKADQLWKAWADSTECESDGRMSFYGIQNLVMRMIAKDGEALIRRRPRRAKDNLTLPLQLQVLESDFLDHGRTAITGQAGGPIVQGVEFDKIGRRAAYWLFPVHPGSGRQTEPSRPVPAEEVIHVFDMERPGQSRGVSWLASSIVNLKDLDDYEDAELMKQKIAACFAAFVTDTDGSAAGLGEVSGDDLTDTLEPGLISNLPIGKDVKFGNPPGVTSDAFAYRNLRKFCAGMNVPFEEVSGDYTQVNFSSARMSRLSHWAGVRNWQWHMLVPLLCQATWDWAMEAAVLAGELPEAPGSDWTTPPMPMIEPDKEGLAYQRLVRNGVMTYSQMVREQGGDPAAHFAEYAADQKMLDGLGIQLDSDVRAVSQAGLTQVRAGVGGGGSGSDPSAGGE